jgi:hypothetical protein
MIGKPRFRKLLPPCFDGLNYFCGAGIAGIFASIPTPFLFLQDIAATRLCSFSWHFRAATVLYISAFHTQTQYKKY